MCGCEERLEGHGTAPSPAPEKFQQGFNTATQPFSESFSPPQGALVSCTFGVYLLFLSLPNVLSKTVIFFSTGLEPPNVY